VLTRSSTGTTLQARFSPQAGYLGRRST
jgi:hypothetical protein